MFQSQLYRTTHKYFIMYEYVIVSYYVFLLSEVSVIEKG